MALYKKLSESEIEMMECFYNPVCMIETLIPENFRAPQTWIEEDCKLLKLRNYQFSMVDYSPLFADDDKLNAKQNFQSKQGAGYIINVAARNLGKCEYEENRCLLANGEIKKFKDLIGTFQTVLSYNEEIGNFEPDKAYFSNNGLKDCYKIVLKSGKEIILTENHPLLSNDGWKKVSELTLNHMIATPKDYGECGNIVVEENLSKLLGYLLGDGSCGQANISVTNINKDIISEIYDLAKFFNCKVRYDKIYGYHFSRLIRNNSKNDIQKIVLEYGINKLAKNKTIPSQIFLWTNNLISILLNRLFACDGTINVNGDDLVIEITLASKQLIYDIQHLLLRFGIHSDIHYKKSKCNNKYFDAWRLTVCKDASLFLKNIGIFSKDNNIKLKDETWSTSDVIPKNLVYKYTQNKHYFDDSRKYGFSRIKVNKIGLLQNNTELIKLANENIYWEPIIEIVSLGELPTVEVYCSKNHNYISNDIISHNSLFCLIDAFLTLIYSESGESCVASFDFAHLKKIATPIANLANYHPFFELYKRKGKECVRFTGGGMEIDTLLGHVLFGKNENCQSPDPGTAYHSLHCKKFIFDEVSYQTTEGRKKMVDAISSEGCIERLAGINDVRLGSPLGIILRDESKRNWICNMPQYVREDFDEQTKKRLIEEYGGEQSLEFKLNVLGEMVEGANSYFDMNRIREKSYNPKKHVKQFEIGKETFSRFDKILVIDKQPAVHSWICSDIGTTGSPSEICIFFGDNKLMKWRYNVPLFMLTVQEQAKVFKWMYDKLDNVIISLDCTESAGRAIADELVILGVPQDNIVRCMFNAKMIVGFEKTNDDVIRCDERGNPIYKFEQQIDFANMQLEHCLYNGLIEVPHSEKFLREFANYFMVNTGTSRRYGTTSTNHLLQSFQCMSIARFNYEFASLTQPQSNNQFVAGF